MRRYINNECSKEVNSEISKEVGKVWCISVVTGLIIGRHTLELFLVEVGSQTKSSPSRPYNHEMWSDTIRG